VFSFLKGAPCCRPGPRNRLETGSLVDEVRLPELDRVLAGIQAGDRGRNVEAAQAVAGADLEPLPLDDLDVVAVLIDLDIDPGAAVEERLTVVERDRPVVDLEHNVLGALLGRRRTEERGGDREDGDCTLHLSHPPSAAARRSPTQRATATD
jgi:hypothetical protein